MRILPKTFPEGADSPGHSPRRKPSPWASSARRPQPEVEREESSMFVMFAVLISLQL